MKKLILCTCLSAALLPASVPALAADNLGRLFFTPAQRTDLDRRRQANAQDSLVAVDNFVTVNGQVSSSSGKTTTWINGQPAHANQRAKDPARAIVPMGDDQTPAEVRVGETLDKVRGERRDVVGKGQLKVPAAKP